MVWSTMSSGFTLTTFSFISFGLIRRRQTNAPRAATSDERCSAQFSHCFQLQRKSFAFYLRAAHATSCHNFTRKHLDTAQWSQVMKPKRLHFQWKRKCQVVNISLPLVQTGLLFRIDIWSQWVSLGSYRKKKRGGQKWNKTKQNWGMCMKRQVKKGDQRKCNQVRARRCRKKTGRLWVSRCLMAPSEC